MITLKLFKCADKPNTINKTLTNETIVKGLFYGEKNILQPILQIRRFVGFSENTFNYAFISDLNRYYFISDISIKDSGVIVLNLKIDVLKTYQNNLFAAVGTVTQNENANKFISDRRKIYDIRPKFDKIDFNYTFEKGDIVMITLKGNININE